MVPELSHDQHRRDDHSEIEAALEVLTQACEAGMALEPLRELWCAFAATVETHFQMEERHLFRRADLYASSELLRLWADHTDLRERIERMTEDVEHRTLRPEVLAAFRAKLEAHAELEDRTSYAWASWDSFELITRG